MDVSGMGILAAAQWERKCLKQTQIFGA